MAASSTETSSLYTASYLDRRNRKQIRDNVHGNIYVDSFFLQFVDTEQFQRLRDLKQLGLTYMVYPGAVHSRFEHSLGVYWLAGEVAHRIKAQQGLELDIEDFDVKTVKLAGLLHDVGHGPFSHTFEREFLPRINKDFEWSHEDMSLKMIDHMVDSHHIDIDSECLNKAKDMIISSTENASYKSTNGKRFLYDIVANGRNGIDVDKFDYIVRDSRACGLGCNFKFEMLMDNMRVMEDEICYRAKHYLTVYKLFTTRADLHRTVYTHAKVKAIELMVVDALSKANDHLHISDRIEEPAEFWKLDDTIVKTIEVSHEPELKEARELIRRIRKRDLYQYVNEFSVPAECLDNFQAIAPKDIICYQEACGVTLKEDDIAVSNVKIDLTRGNLNPLKSVKFFQDYESAETFSIEDHRVSHLLPANSLDRIVRVYAKNHDLVKVVAKAFENFQEDRYGRKAQVHETPVKKKNPRKLAV